jgi:hypothetical protein
MDLPGAQENLEALQSRFPTVEIVPLSAQTDEGLEELCVKLEKWLVNASQREPVAYYAKIDKTSSGD